MARGDSYQLQGQQGGVVLGAGDEASGNFRWIQIVNDTVLDVFDSGNLSNAGLALCGPTLPAGLGIGGQITNITVITGLIIAYYE